MKEPIKITDELLLDYIDGSLSSKQKELIEYIIDENKEVREKLNELQKMDSLLSHITLDIPPENFTAKVMGDLSASIYEINRKARLNGLIILLFGILTVLVGATFISDGFNNLSFTSDISTDPITNVLELAPKEIPVTLNMGIFSQGLLFLLLILSLLILDRVVLRPYFKNRRSQLNF